MKHAYYVEKIAGRDGYHNVHSSMCTAIPEKNMVIYLGVFDNCILALQEARRRCIPACGCPYCCSAIN